MRYDTCELILNHITTDQFLPPFQKDWDEYKQLAFLYLNQKDKYLFESDILSLYNQTVTLDQIFKANPERFAEGSNQQKNGKTEPVWYDLWAVEEITYQDRYFDLFFTLKLRHLSLLDIDEYLGFHLEYSFNHNKKEYFRFLQLAMRQYGEKLNSSIIQTVEEWIKAKEGETKAGTEAESDETIKGRMRRESGDRLTVLSLNQTALLIEYLQTSGIILKGDNLTYVQAGRAFHILTGYSAHTIRQQLGTKGTINGFKHEDYEELHRAISRLLALVDESVRKK